MYVSVKGGGRDAQRACPAVADADAAGAAKSRVNNGFFPLRAGNARAWVTVTVEQSTLWANATANAAGNASANVDHMPLFWCAVDCEDRALPCACGAAVACLGDKIGHRIQSPLDSILDVTVQIG